jgi:hypothetical protein
LGPRQLPGLQGNITSSKQRRNKDDPVKQFFTELRYDHHFGTPMVEICTIIGKWPAFFDIANFWYIFEFNFFCLSPFFYSPPTVIKFPFSKKEKTSRKSH